MSRKLVALVIGLLAVTAVTAPADAQELTRYVRYEQNGAVSWGVLEGETIYQLSDAPYLNGSRTGQSVQRSDVTLKAPVNPGQVYMTALNFRSHAGDPAAYPGIFTVPPGSISDPEAPFVLPADAMNFHYETEVIVVVGRHAEDVPIEEAGDYIFGVTAGNDGSERSWQANDLQWTRAKGSETFNPVGPVLVRGLDYKDLDMEGRLNGEVVQTGNTSQMYWGFEYMLSYISRYFTLEPGDLIWSGTVGTTHPMEPGDTFEVDIEGVGVLRNTVTRQE